MAEEKEKSILDEFTTKEVVSKTWDNDIEGEASCAICDKFFVPAPNRPPIFCPGCKQALKKFMFTKLR